MEGKGKSAKALNNTLSLKHMIGSGSPQQQQQQQQKTLVPSMGFQLEEVVFIWWAVGLRPAS
ncbi:hypothetical protein M514_02655 [Trichuris suis]|uniref:Uncharacterized protein n=1 Tax=Trichuris suis TaxID=68888 RepID=A0A085NNN5_9BILA|nr:hypothetical protein M513_02655 [Trichuris suis]KFD71081.1 hypothetical protein M514_02655 [Trichuris suis]